MRFLLYGEDTCRSKKKLAQLRARFKSERDPAGLNERIFCAERDDVSAVVEAVYSSPFLADRKLVILENYLSLDKVEQQTLVDFLTKQPESTVVIFYQSNGSETLKSAPLFDLLKNEKFSEEFKSLTAEQAVGFIASHCAERESKIEVRACRELISAIGTNAWSLQQEVGKLCAYAKAHGCETITVGVVKEMVQGNIEDRMFDFLDACVSGRSNEAISLLENIISAGTNELQILAMLQKQVSLLTGVKDLIERGITDRNKAANLLGAHPYPTGKAMLAVRVAKISRLKFLLNELVEIEHRAKIGTGRIKTEIGLFATKVITR
jgi:DNA polymerase III delta subunit